MDNSSCPPRDNTHIKTTPTLAAATPAQMAAVSLLNPINDFAPTGRASYQPKAQTGSGYLPTPPSTSPPPQSRGKAVKLQTLEMPSYVTGSAEALMQARISELAINGEDEGAFFVGDLGEVWKAWKSWVTELSRVELFYGQSRVDAVRSIVETRA